MEIFYSAQISEGMPFLPAEESRHCIKVLRHRKGDEILVCSGDGNLYRCMLESEDLSGALLSVKEVLPGMGGHDYHLEMAVAPTKNADRFEWFLEKATEMGVDRVIPLLCDHSERKVYKKERGERVILSAVKQSLKTYVPVLEELTSFSDLLAQSSSFGGQKFIAFCDEETFGQDGVIRERITLREAVRRSSVPDGGRPEALCLIGPEGDFSSREVEAALQCGFLPLSLGPSRLRTETAALVCVSAYYL